MKPRFRRFYGDLDRPFSPVAEVECVDSGSGSFPDQGFSPETNRGADKRVGPIRRFASAKRDHHDFRIQFLACSKSPVLWSFYTVPVRDGCREGVSVEPASKDLRVSCNDAGQRIGHRLDGPDSPVSCKSRSGPTSICSSASRTCRSTGPAGISPHAFASRDPARCSEFSHVSRSRQGDEADGIADKTAEHFGR